MSLLSIGMPATIWIPAGYWRGELNGILALQSWMGRRRTLEGKSRDSGRKVTRSQELHTDHFSTAMLRILRAVSSFCVAAIAAVFAMIVS